MSIKGNVSTIYPLLMFGLNVTEEQTQNHDPLMVLILSVVEMKKKKFTANH